MKDFFNARDVLKVGDQDYVIYRLDALEKAGLTTSTSFRFRSGLCSRPHSVNVTTMRSDRTM